MKAALTLVALAFWQLLDAPPAPPAQSRYLTYQRSIHIPPQAQGQACAVLDAAVYAHAAKASARDLRLFAASPGAPPHEVPYALSESETQPAELETATVLNRVLRKGDIAFDLAMPRRPYSTIDLQLNAHDFLAVARVSGAPASGGPATALGTFTLFDLTSLHLGRSTALALAEASFPILHVTLHLTRPDGAPWPHPDAAIVTTATVPPSREAQVLYTKVAQSTAFVQKGKWTTATFPSIPAHIPIERTRFFLQAGEHASFLRPVSVTARPLRNGSDAIGVAEGSQGVIASVIRAATSSGAPALDYESLTVPATLGSNLDSPAEVSVSIDNGDAPPLPLARVELQMRRRSLCFDAVPGALYTLRYGDPAISAPAYDYARLFTPASHPLEATLGPEQRNPSFTPRADARSYTERHPELVWVGLLVAVAALVLSALESVKRRRHR